MIEKRAVELTNSRSDSRFRLDSILWKREMLDRDIHLEIILAPPQESRRGLMLLRS